MRTSDTLRLSVLFLARRRMRTFLTVLGVIIGTVCIVLMLSIGVSNYTELQEMIAGRSSLTEIQVRSEGTGLSTQDIADMESAAHVEAVSPVLSLPGRLRTGTYEAFVNLTGIYADVLEVSFQEGNMFTSDAGTPQLVVGGDATRDFIDEDSPPDYEDWEAWQTYAPEIDWLGAEFTFLFGYGTEPVDGDGTGGPAGQGWLEDPGERMAVCGVTKRSENMDSTSVYVDLDAARRILMEHAEEAESLQIPLNRYPEALIRVDNMNNVESALAEIRDMGFDAYSDVEYIEEMRQEQSRQLLQLLMIGLISLSVSAIGIANTMYAGILERRRDIGVLKVLGMKRAAIQALFVAEAALIGAVGGLIGLAVSWVFVLILNASMSSGMMLGMYFAEGSRISIPLWVGAGAILVACGTGILSGLWPAAKASKMSALEAMRSGR